MANHSVWIVKSAVKSIKKLGKKDSRLVLKRLEVLEDNPRPSNVEKLTENPKLWRLRAGNLRIIYTIKGDGPGNVIVLLVKKRGEAYRDLDKLGAILDRINLLDFGEQFRPDGPKQ